MDLFVHLDEKKVAIVERWPLGEVQLYISGSTRGGSGIPKYLN